LLPEPSSASTQESDLASALSTERFVVVCRASTVGLTRPVVPESRSRRFGDEALGVLLAPLLDAAGRGLGEEGQAVCRRR
jgi:hypothetical protein